MNGVEILNQTNVYQTEDYPWIIGVLVGVGFVIGLIYLIKDYATYGKSTGGDAAFIMLTALGLVLGLITYICTMHETDKVDYIKYQVTISEEVSLTDFLDKYEILDQEGKIYTVKEKDE